MLKSDKFLLIFIQEHWLPTHEATSRFSSDFSEYEFQTTSIDTFLSPEDIILQKGPVWHGTAIGWHSSVSSHVITIPVVSTRFCGIKLNYNGSLILAYTAYLPTAGQDEEFFEEMSILSHDINKYVSSNSILVIGLDANSSVKSSSRRQEAFFNFKQKFKLSTILPGNEPTFHHNNGISESHIDHILTNNINIVSFLQQKCKLEDSTNISSHDAILGRLKLNLKQNKNEEKDFKETYTEFTPKKLIWESNIEYQKMTAAILRNLLATFDLPEHLPSLAEMSSNMIAICAEKCFKSKSSQKRNENTQKTNTPYFLKSVRDAYENHSKICNDWRKAGRPKENTNPAKVAKIESQRYLQKIQREEASIKAKTQHNDLMDTFNKNLSEVCIKLKKIRGEHCKQNEISEIETYLGRYTGDNSCWQQVRHEVL